MQIILDENISFAKEAFSTMGDVKLYPGREITNEKVKQADALIVRSVTKVNEQLLKDTSIKFVGTATIGTDHIDKEYLESQNIFFTDAAGCNADAVTEFVFTLLAKIILEKKMKFNDLTIGVVGVGNIGSRVSRLGKLLGMKVLKNDPPLKRKTGDSDFVELEEVLGADIITLHVPLNKEGIDRTYHLFDKEILSKLKENLILINSSRGPVINNTELEQVMDGKNFTVCLDVWENEPLLNLDLLKKVRFGTPHIAGYSLEGKVNGTVMVYNQLCKFLNTPPKWKSRLEKVENSTIEISEKDSFEKTLNNIFSRIHKFETDDKSVRGLFEIEEDKRGKYFDGLRKNYSLRREFNNYTVLTDEKEKELINILKAFRFNVRQL